MFCGNIVNFGCYYHFIFCSLWSDLVFITSYSRVLPFILAFLNCNIVGCIDDYALHDSLSFKNVSYFVLFVFIFACSGLKFLHETCL